MISVSLLHIGVDFKTKIVTHKDKRYKLQLWDTAGQERYDSLRRGFYRGAKVREGGRNLFAYSALQNLPWEVTVVYHVMYQLIFS